MSNLISKLKNLSSKVNPSTVTVAPPEAESVMNEEFQANSPITLPPQLDPNSSPNEESSVNSLSNSTTTLESEASTSPETSSPSAVAASLSSLKTLGGYVVKPFTGERPLHKRYLFWIGLGVSSGAIALGYTAYKLETSLPDSGRAVLTYARPNTLTIQAADGTILQQLGAITHEEIEVEDAPEIVLQAFIASEDRHFYKHGGLDPKGILRASWANLRAGDIKEGGSTITQQLARIVYFDQEPTLWRKLREGRMAQRIENQLEKDDILEQYLNLVYLGSDAYGVADAAWRYFGKSVEDLTLSEAATLAGVAPAPSLYSPLQNPQAAETRRNQVLRRMEKDGYISTEEAESAIASPLNLNPSNPKRFNRQAPYFTDYIQTQLPQYISPQVLQQGGVVIETTLNPEWQKVAEETVAKKIERYGKYQRFEQAALVAIDPRNGEIKAMVGGDEYEDNQYNRVTQAQRQPGSTFKTFVYATAIATGMSPSQGFLDAPYVVDGYQPENYSRTYRGWVSMRDALTSSINTVAVRTLVDVGWNPIIKLAQKMGIQSELNPSYSLALGASEVNLLELTSAYGTFANEGQHHSTTGIHRILNREGQVIYQAKLAPIQALDAESTAITTAMLENVVKSGTGRPAQIGRPVAGKTGTSDDSRDLWFIGYIPQMVTGVWLGNDDNQPTRGSSGIAAETWHDFMQAVVENMEVEEFPEVPDNLDDREGTIKAEPIEAESRYNQAPVRRTTAPQNRSNRRQSSPSRPRRSTPRRRSSPAPAPAPKRTYNNNPAPAPKPRYNANPAPAPKPAAPPRNESPAPSNSAPAPEPKRVAPPAPPQPATPPVQTAPPSAPKPPMREAISPPPAPPAPQKVTPPPAPAAPPAPAIPIPVEPAPQPAAPPPAPARELEVLPAPPSVPN